jgi:hypothetical protein
MTVQDQSDKGWVDSDSAIVSALCKAVDARLALADLPMRIDEQRSIQRRQQKLSAINQALADAFEAHCRNLAGRPAPALALVESMDSARSLKKDIIKSISLSGEPKRMPFLVTPQFA